MASVSATTDPTATPAPIIAPILKTIERTRCCFAGAIATPEVRGRDAACGIALPRQYLLAMSCRQRFLRRRRFRWRRAAGCV